MEISYESGLEQASCEEIERDDQRGKGKVSKLCKGFPSRRTPCGHSLHMSTRRNLALNPQTLASSNKKHSLKSSDIGELKQDAYNGSAQVFCVSWIDELFGAKQYVTLCF